jgi:hypothetical protein
MMPNRFVLTGAGFISPGCIGLLLSYTAAVRLNRDVSSGAEILRSRTKPLPSRKWPHPEVLEER